MQLSQSEFIEIASNLLSADTTVSNAHKNSDEQNYRTEIDNGIDRIFTETLTGNRDIGYSVPEMSQLWDEFQSSSVEEHIQTIVAENVDITLTANEQLTEYIKSVVQSLAERAEKISKGQVSRSEDNMLVVTGDGRKLGLDQRLFDFSFPDEPQTMLNEY